MTVSSDGLKNNPVIIAFLESIKYVGHLWPVALLRWTFAYMYLNQAIHRYQEGYLSHAYINEGIRLSLPGSVAPDWYRGFLAGFVQENWQVFSYALTSAEFAVGLSFLFGYLVRPFSVVGILVATHLMWSSGTDIIYVYQLHIFVLLTFLLLGAGRCLGVDYYFYKRRRGIWW